MSTVKEKISVKVGAKIRETRKGKHIGLRELAETANISPSHLCEIELGKRDLTLTKLAQIAKALDVGIVRLIPTT